jgi:hypothetical protein
MSRALRFAAVFALVAPLLLVTGCKQGVGERCQTTDDCNDGLICVLPAGGSVQAGGTCKATDESGSADLSVGDMNTNDGAPQD